jgi:hypothetical protein
MLCDLKLADVDGDSVDDSAQFSVAGRLAVRNEALFVDSTAYFLLDASQSVGILCYRGTEPTNVINWLTNATTSQVPFFSPRVDGARVHEGFYRNLLATWPGVLSLLRAAQRTLKALYITGHSLGGAMAVLAGAILSDSKYKGLLRGVYTYGQPMIGNAVFADQYHGDLGTRLYRHVHNRDIVPRFPPWTAGCFVHLGHEYRATRDSRWALSSSDISRQAVCAAIPMVLGLSAWVFQQLSLTRGIALCYSWDDHQPVYYLRGFLDGKPKNPFDGNLRLMSESE